MSMTPNAYPVTYDVQPQMTDRNRMTCAFRFILAIPHLLLVGGPGLAMSFGSFGWRRDGPFSFATFGAGGVLGAVAGVMSIIAWFSILFTGKHPKGLWDFCAMYLRWRSKAVAYSALLRDEYPPFGEGDYAVSFDLGQMPADGERNKLSVGLRLIYVIPHVFVLFFVGIAWAISAFIGWLVILFSGSYPEGLYNFGVGYLRWSLRVESYLLLMNDVYPPFSTQ
jgi:hypothetical protein